MTNEKKTLKVKCFITGEENIFSGDYLNKLVEKYGSRDNLLKYYISFKAKNLLFKGYSIPEIRKILVLKKIELEDAESDKALDLIKYWQDQKVSGQKFRLKEQEKINFTKTDPTVKKFITLLESHKNLNTI